MGSALSSFLNRNSVKAASGLPLIHTTKSATFKAIMGSDRIDPQECDVFDREKLTYFFVGRPAYKYESSASEAAVWELPCCFVFESDLIDDAKRIFPFDSGAFSNRRYPSYINNLAMSEFDAPGATTPAKLIGAFFGDASRYFAVKPKGYEQFEAEYSLNAFDAEILATSRLASESGGEKFDDRRFTIEVQTDKITELKNSKLIAVIIPEQYLAVDGVLDKIQVEWGAEPIGYPMFPLSVSMYYSTIYNAVLELYRRRGLI